MELTGNEIWDRVLEEVEDSVPGHIFRIWFEPTEPIALSQDLLAISTGSEFAAEWIDKQYGDLLTEIAEEIFGRRLTLSFQHHESQQDSTADLFRPSSALTSPALNAKPAGPGTGGQLDRGSEPAATIGTPLNDRYVFERFIVGGNNQLAAAASRAVAETPARMYNPLFIYGGVGLGKTHLMHAIGHAVAHHDSATRIAYITSERFTNELIVSIQDGRMARFRQRYREIDILLIDDIHFLAEKERTQEEFFHTFNALHDAARQIVLTSDRPPKEIPGLEERLVSRFEWGLVTDIKAPDFETRVAILRKKAEEDNLLIADVVLDFIARNCRSSVRELEGAILKLLAYSSFTKREITIELAQEALGGVLNGADAPPPLSPERIRELVARHWGVPEEGLTSRKRTRELTEPRQVSMYLMHELLDITLVEIGDAFGGRDHSTVIHSIRKVEKELEQPRFRKRIDSLFAELSS